MDNDKSTKQPEEASKQDSTANTGHPVLIKILKWAAIIVVALIALKLVFMLLAALWALVVGVFSWLYAMILNIGTFLLFCWLCYIFVFSSKARARSRRNQAKGDEWQRNQLAKLGIGSHNGSYSNADRMRDQNFNRHVYDERTGGYRDVTVDGNGNVKGESGRIDGDRLKH